MKLAGVRRCSVADRSPLANPDARAAETSRPEPLATMTLVERTRGVIVEWVIANLRRSRFLEKLLREVAPSDMRSPLDSGVLRNFACAISLETIQWETPSAQIRCDPMCCEPLLGPVQSPLASAARSCRSSAGAAAPRSAGTFVFVSSCRLRRETPFAGAAVLHSSSRNCYPPDLVL